MEKEVRYDRRCSYIWLHVNTNILRRREDHTDTSHSCHASKQLQRNFKKNKQKLYFKY